MAIDDKMKDEKLQYKINREAAKISPLSSDKTDKIIYLTGKQILAPDQSRVIEQDKFTYSPLEKALEIETKTIKYQIKTSGRFKSFRTNKPQTKTENSWNNFPKRFRK